jgi:hypothetical protein
VLVEIVLVHEAVVVDEITIAGVARGIDTDALNPARMDHAQVAQGVEVVPFDEEIAPWPRPAREFWYSVKGTKSSLNERSKSISFRSQTSPNLGLRSRSSMIFTSSSLL